MEHDGGKRLKPKGALSALKQYKYVVLTAALGIFLLLLPSGEGKTADTARADGGGALRPRGAANGNGRYLILARRRGETFADADGGRRQRI